MKSRNLAHADAPCDAPRVTPRQVKFRLGARRALRWVLTEVEANALRLRLDEIARRTPEEWVPFQRITEIAGLRVSYEVTEDEIRVWAITRL